MAKRLLMHIRLNWIYVDSDAAATSELTEAAAKAVAKFEQAKISFQLTGAVPLHLMDVESHVMNAAQYQTIGYSIMLLSAD